MNLENMLSEISQTQKNKYCESEVAQSCPTLFDPIDCSLPDSSVHGIFPATVLDCWTEGLPFPSPGDLPKPGLEPGSPEL